ncbi:MAG: ADP-ribosylglycohydrolase family protein [Bacteroidetes bacterium]|nr:MAG: ADP-ribosylglycohydrolase family protein [Bacteroidota bacterium]
MIMNKFSDLRRALIFVVVLLFFTQCKTVVKESTINEAEFLDRVYACWLGKNIGGTLGMPFEGKTDVNNLTFYTNIKVGEPAANDDLDLQILWLKAMEDNNCSVDAYTLGEYWLKYVPVDWNEYGVGKTNMRSGIMPPLSGEYNNAKWKTSNGAWIRSEIWACLAPGNPMLAAQFAWNDACVDHGCSEGTFAEIFTATLESAAFIENDRDKLIKFALSMIPGDCRVAIAVNTAVEVKKSGFDWLQAREAVIKVTEDLGWFQAPRNIAFTLIGWLYGDNDFGKSICIAVNCGDDTDCTGATLGSIFGILYGTIIIPEKWRAPIGDGIKTVAVSGFEVPTTLQTLSKKTVATQKKVAEFYKSQLKITSGKTNVSNQSELLNIDKNELSVIWNRSPYQITRNTEDLFFTCDYNGAPEIAEGESKAIKISVGNKTDKEKLISLRLKNIPAGYTVNGMPDGIIKIGPHSKYDVALSLLAATDAKNATFIAEIGDGGKTIDMQLGIIRLSSDESVGSGNNKN